MKKFGLILVLGWGSATVGHAHPYLNSAEVLANLVQVAGQSGANYRCIYQAPSQHGVRVFQLNMIGGCQKSLGYNDQNKLARIHYTSSYGYVQFLQNAPVQPKALTQAQINAAKARKQAEWEQYDREGKTIATYKTTNDGSAPKVVIHQAPKRD